MKFNNNDQKNTGKISFQNSGNFMKINFNNDSGILEDPPLTFAKPGVQSLLFFYSLKNLIYFFFQTSGSSHQKMATKIKKPFFLSKFNKSHLEYIVKN